MDEPKLRLAREQLSAGSLGFWGNGDARVQVVDLGTRAYREVWDLQRELVEARVAGKIGDTLLLVEHPSVITLGRGAQRGEGAWLQPAPGTEVLPIERGGLATYHGPGQLVAYPIFQLARKHSSRARSGVVDLIRGLESWVVESLGDWGVEALAIPAKTGVWVRGPRGPGVPEERKIASIGIAVRRWVSFHGLALNYNTGSEVWRQLNPCGFGADVMTDLSQELGRAVTRDELLKGLISRLESTLLC